MFRRRVFLLLLVMVGSLFLLTQILLNDDSEDTGHPTPDHPGGRIDYPTGHANPNAPASRGPEEPADVVPSASGLSVPSAALHAAEKFARIWSSRNREWPAALGDLATAELTATLAEVDPTTVPARRVTGSGNVLAAYPSWVSVGVPTDAGTVVLHVVAVAEGWRVSAVDWRPDR